MLIVGVYLPTARVGVFPFAPCGELASADLISAAGELRERTGFGDLTVILVQMGVDKAIERVGIRS